MYYSTIEQRFPGPGFIMKGTVLEEVGDITDHKGIIVSSNILFGAYRFDDE
jgi:hypothetical protein